MQLGTSTHKARSFATIGEKIMTDFNKPTPEDDAFNHVEMMSKVKQEIIKNLPVKTQQEVYDELRNDVIEEVAKEMQRFVGFGKDTIDGLSIHIRSMKR
jgi:hypothetical protein